jgi:hypothetical protein
MLNPFLGSISKIMEESDPGWSEPFVAMTAAFNPDGGWQGKVEIAVYVFVIFLILAIVLLFTIIFSNGSVTIY